MVAMVEERKPWMKAGLRAVVAAFSAGLVVGLMAEGLLWFGPGSSMAGLVVLVGLIAILGLAFLVARGGETIYDYALEQSGRRPATIPWRSRWRFWWSMDLARPRRNLAAWLSLRDDLPVAEARRRVDALTQGERGETVDAFAKDIKQDSLRIATLAVFSIIGAGAVSLGIGWAGMRLVFSGVLGYGNLVVLPLVFAVGFGAMMLPTGYLLEPGFRQAARWVGLLSELERAAEGPAASPPS